MSLEHIDAKIKSLAGGLKLWQITLYFGFLLVIVDSFGLYLIENLEKPQEIKILKNFSAEFFAEKISRENEKKGIIASKNGTKYYFSHCSGLKRIKTENRIYFGSSESAEKAGFTLAANCK